MGASGESRGDLEFRLWTPEATPRSVEAGEANAELKAASHQRPVAVDCRASSEGTTNDLEKALGIAIAIPGADDDSTSNTTLPNLADMRQAAPADVSVDSFPSQTRPRDVPEVATLAVFSGCSALTCVGIQTKQQRRTTGRSDFNASR